MPLALGTTWWRSLSQRAVAPGSYAASHDVCEVACIQLPCWNSSGGLTDLSLTCNYIAGAAVSKARPPQLEALSAQTPWGNCSTKETPQLAQASVLYEPETGEGDCSCRDCNCYHSWGLQFHIPIEQTVSAEVPESGYIDLLGTSVTAPDFLSMSCANCAAGLLCCCCAPCACLLLTLPNEGLCYITGQVVCTPQLAVLCCSAHAVWELCCWGRLPFLPQHI